MGTEPQLYHLPGFHEPFSAISHLLGAVVFLILGCLLLKRGRGNSARVIFLAVYVASGVLLLSMSGSGSWQNGGSPLAPCVKKVARRSRRQRKVFLSHELM
jgi:predicted membrane channel-forming protein YqfA (hemolysin III family)